MTVADDDGGSCILVGLTEVDFGTLAFSTPGAPSIGRTDPYSITNCGKADAELFGRSTNATSSEVTWFLSKETTSDPCGSLPGDQYINGIIPEAAPFPIRIPFGNLDAGTGLSLDAGASKPYSNYLGMPCEGSNGLGQTMSFSFTYTFVGQVQETPTDQVGQP